MDYIKVGDSVHWYTEKGEPRHEATLREARKENLYPSVTTITKVIASPGLESWKLNQLLLASMTLPRVQGEPDDSYAKRVIEDSQAHGKGAAEIGTFVHGWIAQYLSGHDRDTGELGKIIAPAKEWIDENIERAYKIEYTVAGMGYGGTVDALVRLRNGEIARVDWKTQGIKDPGIGKSGKPLKAKVNYYNTWPMQLIAYEELDEVRAQNMNIVISSNPDYPGVFPKTYTREEMDRAILAFDACFEIWKYTNSYYPV